MFVCRRKIHLEDKLLEENELGDVAATAAATTFGSSLLFGRRRGWLYVRKYTTCYSTDESPAAAHAMASHRMRGRQANGRTNDDLNNTTNVDVHNQQYYIGGINQRSSIPIVVIHRCIYLGYAL